MLIPRFSIRFMLLVTTALAGVFLVAGFAYRGHMWALCVVAGVVSVAVAMLVYAGVFGLIWVATGRFAAERGTGGGIRRADRPTAGPSPAADGGP
ncbi:MAG: hypothetical protein WDZ59_13790 [Pirellulales bacterium]